MTSLFFGCAILGFLLSLRVNVVVLAIVTSVGGVGVFGMSMLLGAGLISSAGAVAVSLVGLHAGYVFGLLTQAQVRRRLSSEPHQPLNDPGDKVT